MTTNPNSSACELRADTVYRFRWAKGGANSYIVLGDSRPKQSTGTPHRFYVSTTEPANFLLISQGQDAVVPRGSVSRASYRIINCANGFGIALPTLRKGAVAVQDYDVGRWAEKYGADSRYIDFARWQITNVTGSDGKPYYRVVSELTGEALGKHTTNNYVRPFNRVEYQAAGNDPSKDPTLWEIQGVDSIDLNDDKAKSKLAALDIPTGTLTQAEIRAGVAESTDWVATGIARLPFFVVDDKPLGVPRVQAEVSPYYYLVHEERYVADRSEFGQVPAGQENKKTVTLTTGVEIEQVDGFQKSTGITVAAEGGFSFKGIGVKISGSVTQELGVHHQITRTDRSAKTDSETITNKARETEYYFQEYHVQSRYTLYQMDLSTRVGDTMTFVEADLPTIEKTGVLEA